MLSVCVCVCDLSAYLSVFSWLAFVCVCMSRNMSALCLGLCVCERAYRNVQECECVCCRLGVTARSSSPQTRPDDEEGKRLGAECSGVLCSSLQSGTWPWAATK